jgi:hypothetical protein
MCPPAPLSDRLVEDWPSVRTCTLREGHLFQSLAADGGHYELLDATGKVVARFEARLVQ